MLVRWRVLLVLLLGSSVACVSVGQTQESLKPETQAKVREFETSPEKINQTADGEFPLLKAVRANDYELTKWLLEHGADVDAKSDKGKRAISEVCDLRMAELLVGFHPDLSHGVERAAVKFALSETDEERMRWKQLVDFYVTQGAEYGVEPAVMLDDSDRIKQILSELSKSEVKGALAEIMTSAMIVGKARICSELIDTYQLDVNKPLSPDLPPLFYGGIFHPAILQLMLDKGADLSVPDESRNAHTASKKTKTVDDIANRAEALVNEVIEQLAPVNLYYTILHSAVSEGHPESVRLLLKSGFDPLVSPPDAEGEYLLTPVENAAYIGSLEKTEMLLLHPRFQQLSVDHRQRILNQCLARASDLLTWKEYAAADQELDEILKLLDHHKPDYPAVIKLLLNQGANANSIVEGQTACQRLAAELKATESGVNQVRLEVIQCLLENGTKDQLLAAVAMNDEVAVLKLLTEKSGRADAVAEKGFTSLHLAARLGNPGIVKQLLVEGVDVNSVYFRNTSLFGNKSKSTPLDEALKGEHAEVAELIKANGGRAGYEIPNERVE